MNFTDFVRAAAGHPPYPYQQRLAGSGLPDVLCVPTGAGKTLAATLPWLYRRTRHPDTGVRADTPRWLVLVLPQRTLVEQTVAAVRSWVSALGVDVGVHVLMGGVSADDGDWCLHPERERIFVGTQDMVLSRLLMRGYAEGRSAWPMTFGLLHSGVQFVFDEVQLMGPGLPTSLQLQGLRESLGTAAPCRTMWMSATLDPGRLSTVDFQRAVSTVVLSTGDHSGPLGTRLAATRTVSSLDLGEVDGRNFPRILAARVNAEHRLGTRTLVVCNTVERAVAVHAALTGAATVLLHSRFRPADRRARTDEALHADGIVVATQVLEAGVDLTCDTLVIETAPWSSVVQRAGRCNRDGRSPGARLLWTSPPTGTSTHLPYEVADLAATANVLAGLEGLALTSAELAAQPVAQIEPVHPVLRRRDLTDLFDTAPDLAGNDIDVSVYVRDAADRTVFLAWRAADSLSDNAPAVHREELCPAPVAAVRALVKQGGAWIFDQIDGTWRTAREVDVRPFGVIVLDAARGGYRPEVGFDPESREPVEPVGIGGAPADAVDTDPHSAGTARWVSLAEHLADTEHEARALFTELDPPGLDARVREAVEVAARYHDLGKSHPTFANALLRANPDQPPPAMTTVWAKSPGSAPLRHDPPHFRHELVSALVLADRETALLDGLDEPDLVVYLALSHHGKVRLTIRGHPDEPVGTVRGVRDGDSTLPAELPTGMLPSLTLSLSAVGLGAGSLTSAALRLLDRFGPFRLANAEAMVRCADWRASARPGGAGWPN